MGIIAAPVTSRADLHQTLRDHVRLALGMTSPRPIPVRMERRRETRHLYPYPVRLTPVDEKGNVLVGDDLFVIAKHLSERGIDFYYREPVSYRRVIASLPCGAADWISLLLELTWCRFGAHTWYENGGRFLRPIGCPVELEQPVSIDELKVGVE